MIEADAGSSPRQRNASRWRGLLFVALAGAVVALDQWTKQLAVQHLLQSEVRSVPVPFLGDYLRLTYLENRGAAFGVLQNQTAFFVIVGVVVIGIIAASYRHLPDSGVWLHLALGLQLGGAVGNLVDRLRQGYVVDFFDFGYRANWWPVFNISDSAIVVGVALLGLSLLRQPAAEGRQRPAAPASDAV